MIVRSFRLSIFARRRFRSILFAAMEFGISYSERWCLTHSEFTISGPESSMRNLFAWMSNPI